MTEEEWFAISESEIRHLVGASSPRRQRLLAVATCRVLGEWINYPAAHAALEVAETFADTGKTKAALRRSRQSLVVLRNELYAPSSPLIDGGVEHALFGIQVAASENAVIGTVCHVIESLIIAEGIADQGARRTLFPVFRDIIGNPFRPISFSPSWRTETAVLLARQMYDSREFRAMPILADALQDADCDSDDILNHCRDAKQTHVRGCWVVDLVLGKE